MPKVGKPTSSGSSKSDNPSWASLGCVNHTYILAVFICYMGT